MSDPNEDFADAAMAAIQQGNQKDASSDEGGSESAGADPILEFAKTLKEIGVTPDTARDTMQRIAYMQTPQGQEEMYSNFLRTEQGARIRQQFGQEVLADMLAKNPDAVFKMAQEFGYKPSQDSRTDTDDDLTPELKEIRAMKAQQAALENRIKQLSEGAGSKIQELEGKLRGREDAEVKRDAFVEWTKTQTPLSQKAYSVIAKRAHELSILYPAQYAGASGFRKAASDAHSEYSSSAQYFQPKPRPRNGSGGGGVAGKTTVDDSKMTLEQRIEAAAEDFARMARGED